MKKKYKVKDLIIFILLFIYGLINCGLIVYMILCSFQAADSDIFSIPPKIIPTSWRFKNYVDAIQQMNYLRALGNTTIITLSSTAICTVSTLFVAYGFARFNAKGKEFVFMLLISTMMLPWVVTMIPSFVVFKKIGWIGTKLPLIVPAIGGSAFYIFLIKQYIQGIPKAVDEAAKIDGANDVQILFRILIPNLKPIIAYMLIMSITGSYGDFLGPSIYLINQKDYTIALAIRTLKDSYGITNWRSSMAASVIYSVPLIAVFLVGQKQILQGLSITGVKQ